MDERDYTVYMHRLFDGRVYIGITSKDPKRRWLNGSGYIKNQRFYNAIKKYGWDSFDHLILESGLSKQDAEKREVELIAEYDSTNRNKGFNISLGGSCCVPLNEETKELIRKKATGKTASEETKAKMSATRKGRKQSPEHIKHRAETRIGTHLSEETKAKISLSNSSAHSGHRHSESTRKKMSDNSGKARKIIQMDLNGHDVCVFRSMAEAARACSTSTQNIWLAANNSRKTAGGYMWRYAEGAV